MSECNEDGCSCRRCAATPSPSAPLKPPRQGTTSELALCRHVSSRRQGPNRNCQCWACELLLRMVNQLRHTGLVVGDALNHAKGSNAMLPEDSSVEKPAAPQQQRQGRAVNRNTGSTHNTLEQPAFYSLRSAAQWTHCTVAAGLYAQPSGSQHHDKVQPCSAPLVPDGPTLRPNRLPHRPTGRGLASFAPGPVLQAGPPKPQQNGIQDALLRAVCRCRTSAHKIC